MTREEYSYSSSHVSGSNNIRDASMFRPQSPQHLDGCLDMILEDLQTTVSRPNGLPNSNNLTRTKRYATSSAANTQYGESHQDNQLPQSTTNDIEHLTQLLDLHGNTDGFGSLKGSDSRLATSPIADLSKNSALNNMKSGEMTYSRTETTTRDMFATDNNGRIYRGTSPLRLTGPGAPALQTTPPSTTKSFIYTDHKTSSYIPPAGGKSEKIVEYNIPITKDYSQGYTNKKTVMHSVNNQNDEIPQMDMYNRQDNQMKTFNQGNVQGQNFERREQYEYYKENVIKKSSDQESANRQFEKKAEIEYYKDNADRSNSAQGSVNRQNFTKKEEYEFSKDHGSRSNSAQGHVSHPNMMRKEEYEFSRDHTDSRSGSAQGNVGHQNFMKKEEYQYSKEHADRSNYAQGNVNRQNFEYHKDHHADRNNFAQGNANRQNFMRKEEYEFSKDHMAKSSADKNVVPQNVDELMETFSKSGNIEGYNQSRKAEMAMQQSGGNKNAAAVDGRNVYNVQKSASMTQSGRQGVGMGNAANQNVVGPPVYYPPSYGMFAGEGQQNAAAGGNNYHEKKNWKTEEKYRESGKPHSRSKDGSKKTAVPICLPLCCGLPCVIM